MSSKLRVPKFVLKLWSLVESGGRPDNFIHWVNSGNSFAITDPKLFCQRILPRHFRHANLTSFVRQLNMYNFHKVKAGEFQFQFEHQLFRRGYKELLFGIKRKPTESDLQFASELVKTVNFKRQMKQEEGVQCPDPHQLSIKLQANSDPKTTPIQFNGQQNLKVEEESPPLRQPIEVQELRSVQSLPKLEMPPEDYRHPLPDIPLINFNMFDFMKPPDLAGTVPHPSMDYLRFATETATFSPSPYLYWTPTLVLPRFPFVTGGFFY